MNKKSLYLECASGISGDMFVASMIDLGVDKDALLNVLESMDVDGYKIQITRVKKAGIDACDFNVILEDNHDHDMEYLHGHNHNNMHEEGHTHHGHENEEGHTHHGHEHNDDHSHNHVHRNMTDVFSIIDSGRMTEHTKTLAKKIFKIIAAAEAKAHGVPENEVHFHEVGAVDSIIDIVGAAFCVESLGLDDIIVPAISEGGGTIRCQHGILPVPVPAVLNIVQDNNITIRNTGISGELVTPTGAAICAAIMTTKKLPDSYKVTRVGIGAGKREYEIPSLLRTMIIEDESDLEDSIYKLETNIDDCTGENLGYVMDRLFDEGARDVHFIPIYMKKNRPAYELVVICVEKDVSKLEKIIFEETTTIGIRRQKMNRTVLNREMIEVTTSCGKAIVKVCNTEDGCKYYPEYSSVVNLCRENNIPYQEAFNTILMETKRL